MIGQRRILPYGDRAVLIECDEPTEVHALQNWLEQQPPPGLREMVAGARTLLLRLDRPPDDALRRLVTGADVIAPDTGAAPLVEIEVDYDGDDLAAVASLTQLSPEQVVAAHTGQQWTVAFCGFAPGFAYLCGTDARLRVPRRASPRTRVPPGAVGLADQWSGIYPRSAPGGWQLIGRTDAEVWNLDRDPPALLQPGTRVRFVDRAGSGAKDAR